MDSSPSIDGCAGMSSPKNKAKARVAVHTSQADDEITPKLPELISKFRYLETGNSLLQFTLRSSECPN